MRKIERLRLEALETCKFRGHKMERFEHFHGPLSKIAHSQCKVCGKTVAITTHPPPNGIAIGGEAVALGCDD